MSQQPGPYGQLPILLPVAGEPPIVKDRLPIEAISILYFRTLKAGHAVTQDMVVQLYIKANGVLISEGQTPPKCNIDAQSEVIQVANKSRKDFGWEWEPANVGRYIASGLWQYEDLDAATRPSDEIFQEVHKKHEEFTAEAPSLQIPNDVYTAARERIAKNREHSSNLMGIAALNMRPPQQH